MATVVRIKNDCSIIVALHAGDMDQHRGEFQYDSHLTLQSLDKVMPCIDMDGQLKMDMKAFGLNPTLPENISNPSGDQSKMKSTSHSSDYGLRISSFINGTDDMMQLLPLLQHIGLNAVTDFIYNHFTNHRSPDSIRKAYFTALPMNRMLPNDVMGHILSFESPCDLRRHSAVSKSWNRLCGKAIGNQSESDAILMNDESVKTEILRLKRVRDEAVRDKKKDMKGMKKEIRVISESFNRRIEELKRLLTVRCRRCNQPQEVSEYHIEWGMSCNQCGINTLCRNCMKHCEIGDGNECASEEYWCPECFVNRPICEECGSRLCPYCDQHQKIAITAAKNDAKLVFSDMKAIRAMTVMVLWDLMMKMRWLKECVNSATKMGRLGVMISKV